MLGTSRDDQQRDMAPRLLYATPSINRPQTVVQQCILRRVLVWLFLSAAVEASLA